MNKLDLKKTMKYYFSAPVGKIEQLTLSPLNYLMIDGYGDPNKPENFEPRVSALYGLAYTLKFLCSGQPGGTDYVVPPLEGLWWSDDMETFSEDTKAEWKWTLMILQPDFINDELFLKATDEYIRKKKLKATPEIRLAMHTEATCVQALHLGPYTNEAPLIKQMHEYIHDHGWTLCGRHHEIYLNNPQKTPAEKLKTIIRQPYCL